MPTHSTEIEAILILFFLIKNTRQKIHIVVHMSVYTCVYIYSFKAWN